MGSENAMSHKRGQISSMALKGLQKFHKRTAEKLDRQINCFTNLLKKTTDPRKRGQISQWIAGWRAERRSLLQGWKKSRIRSDMLENDCPASVRAMDEVLEFKRETGSDRQQEIDRKYRFAGRIINRNKKVKKSLCG